MSSGETLLKITEYPFSYSIVTIVFASIFVINQDTKFLNELAIGGSLGTFLTIADPLGRLVRYDLKKKFEGRENDSKYEYCRRAVDTRSIGIEVDKIVGLVYFSFVLFLISCALILPSAFIDNIDPKDNSKNYLWDPNVVKYVGFIVSVFAMIILAWVLKHDWKKIIGYVQTVGTYQYGISSQYATRETIENMRNPVDLNDWSTAKEWAKIIEHEIDIKKAKKDEIINQAKLVYEPLYQEFLQIESAIKSVVDTKIMPSFYTTEWEKIKNSAAYLSMQDIQLKDQIEKFYDLIDDYQYRRNIASSKCSSIIKDTALKYYGFPVNEIHCLMKTLPGESSMPELQHLLLTQTSPFEYAFPTTISSIEIRSQDGNSFRKRTDDDIRFFGDLWNEIVDRAGHDSDISETRTLFNNMKKQSPSIKIKLMEKIREQWET